MLAVPASFAADRVGNDNYSAADRSTALPVASDDDVRDEDFTPSENPGAENLDPLDDLFAKLKTEKRPFGASRIATQIVGLWNESGSDTINLLMEWASDAMNKKQYAVAQDFLDQVTTLKPEFAEGWNRRATLYYMMSDYGRSLADIERTLALEPRHFGALSGLAAILQKTGQERHALDAWYRVLNIYPANRQAQKTVIELEEELSGEGI